MYRKRARASRFHPHSSVDARFRYITRTSRNKFRGPGAWNFDTALTKQFNLTERLRLEFRAEGFNIFNHHNYYVNALNLDAANFTGGPITVSTLKGGLGTKQRQRSEP
jgi:hypothetical protein